MTIIFKRILFVSSPFILFGGYIYHKSNIPDNEKLNLVFDLDYTLIHAKKYKYAQFDNLTKFRKPYTMIETENEKYIVYKRPYIVPVLNFLSKFNNIHLFTSADREYGEDMCKVVFEKDIFKTKHFREHMNERFKDLDLIKGDINKKILIDDKIFNHKQNQNFYHISPYKLYINNDKEMLKLTIKVILMNIFGIRNYN